MPKDLWRFRCEACGREFVSANPLERIPCAYCSGTAVNLGTLDPPEIGSEAEKRMEDRERQRQLFERVRRLKEKLRGI
jgi:hypothetical protein